MQSHQRRVAWADYRDNPLSPCIGMRKRHEPPETGPNGIQDPIHTFAAIRSYPPPGVRGRAKTDKTSALLDSLHSTCTETVHSRNTRPTITNSRRAAWLPRVTRQHHQRLQLQVSVATESGLVSYSIRKLHRIPLSHPIPTHTPRRWATWNRPRPEPNATSTNQRDQADE